MTRAQRRIAQPVALFLVGVTVTLGLSFAAIPLSFGMDGSLWLAVFAVGLLITLDAAQLATPKRRRSA